jgi:hypothetical protein
LNHGGRETGRGTERFATNTRRRKDARRVAAQACNGKGNHGDTGDTEGHGENFCRKDTKAERTRRGFAGSQKNAKVAAEACNEEIEPRGHSDREMHGEICHEGAKVGRNAKG